MKPKEILKILKQHGFTFEEGGNHTKAFAPDGQFKTTIDRHTRDLPLGTLRSIEKQTGVTLRK